MGVSPLFQRAAMVKDRVKIGVSVKVSLAFNKLYGFIT